MDDEITYAELVEMLDYDYTTGIFTWKKSPSNSVKAGSVAGTLNKSTGYVRIKLKGTLYQAHRLAWLYCMQCWPENFIDHENGIRDDNRLDNLRDATRTENNRNAGKRSDNTTGYKGVHFDKNRNKYRAMISLNGKRQHLGLFTTALEAFQAYQATAKQHFGDFKRT